MSKLYNLNNEFIRECIGVVPENFTGINVTDNGHKFWRLNGERHRLDGPAVDCTSTGSQYSRYYIHGKYIDATPESFKLLVDVMKLKGLL